MKNIRIVVDARCSPNTVYVLDPTQMVTADGVFRFPWYARFRVTRWIARRLGLWRSYTARFDLY